MWKAHILLLLPTSSLLELPSPQRLYPPTPGNLVADELLVPLALGLTWGAGTVGFGLGPIGKRGSLLTLVEKLLPKLLGFGPKALFEVDPERSLFEGPIYSSVVTTECAKLSEPIDSGLASPWAKARGIDVRGMGGPGGPPPPVDVVKLVEGPKSV